MRLDDAFNQGDYLGFVQGFFPDFAFDNREVRLPANSLIQNMRQLGYSEQAECSIFVANCGEDNANRRIAITQNTFRVLREHGIRNALVAFNYDIETWRLSLLTSTLELKDGRVVSKSSNPRRYSYQLGVGTKTRTAYEYLIRKGVVQNIEDLKSRFSVEMVNKQFYNSIATLFSELVGGQRDRTVYSGVLSISGVISACPKHQEFAVRLIGRIVFCWFLREKKSNTGIPLIPYELLSRNAIDSNPDYYHTILEPLFFELLNKLGEDRKPEYKNKPFSLVPYLNGGLFSVHPSDRYDGSSNKNSSILIPDAWFIKLFDVFETYNFTVDENTSYDIDLSIDPEMLGRIFENLLAEINPETGESARKKTGSYYTRREIVEYMVDTSLLEYMKNKTKIDENKLKSLMSYGQDVVEEQQLSEVEGKQIVEALSRITVLDPACGSGAFPIGMLQKVVYILQQVDPNARKWLGRYLDNIELPELRRDMERHYRSGNLDYIRKLGVIRDSIFGVDIQAIATEIAKLRCFLTLVIEEEVDDATENRGVKALPNLEFKFVTANSLMQLPKKSTQAHSSIFEDTSHIDALRKIREDYFAADASERTKLRAQFEELQKEMLVVTTNEFSGQASVLYSKLSRWKPFDDSATDWFDPSWMFGIEKFDVIIGNPPYISATTMVEINKDMRDVITKSKLYSTLFQKWDIYVPFIELGLSFLSEGGVFSMIVPYPITNQIYAKKIRRLILSKYKMFEIVDLSGTKVFDSATVSNCIPFITNASSIQSCFVSHIDAQWRISRTFTQPYTKLVQEEKTGIWNLSTEQREACRHSEMNTLGDYCYISIGMVLNADEKTAKGEFVKADLISTCKNDVHTKKYIEGKDLEKYFVKRVRFLEWGTERCPGGLRRATFPELYESPKLLVNALGELKAAIDLDEKYYCEQQVRMAILWKDLIGVNNKSITSSVKKYSKYNRSTMESLSNDVDLKCLLAIINSSYASILLRALRGGDYHIVPGYLRNLPIPRISRNDKDRLVHLVNKILLAKTKDLLTDTTSLENEIDVLVYQLYGLTAEEIALVEESTK